MPAKLADGLGLRDALLAILNGGLKTCRFEMSCLFKNA